MKIATFNVNGIRGRLPNLLEWLADAKPDVVCLQELRIHQGEFPVDAIRIAGYGALWQGQASRYNGVAILARGAEPIEVRRTLPGDAQDAQARYLEAAVNGVLFCCLYAPNGNPQPGPKFDYKLAWLDRLATHAAGLFASGLPIALAGDYNIVPADRDIYSTSSYDDNALVQPESRAAFRRLLDQGWVDAVRAKHPSQTVYTFWDYMRKRWERDAGLRIDHLLLSADLAGRLGEAGMDKEARGRPGASDHAPVWITVHAGKKRVAVQRKK
ncbi:MAG: exodeoxyribonuclease III [Betaproteobacteria bacterium]